MGDSLADRPAFRCPCGCGRADMTVEFIRAATLLEARVGRKIGWTSGFRCEKHQADLLAEWEREKVEWDAAHPGKKFPKPHPAKTGQHPLGKAGDFVAATDDEFGKIIAQAPGCGFKGIGLGRRFGHLDVRSVPACWRY